MLTFGQAVIAFGFVMFQTGDYMKVYQCNNYLAKYFQSTGDKWLADHFYQNCLLNSTNVTNDDGKVAAEGQRNVGICLEEAGILSLCYLRA